MTHCLDESDCPPGLMRLFGKSSIALTLVDPAMADEPLIAINEPFCRATGYAPDQALGRNCRFLQPAQGAGPVRQRMHAFVHSSTSDAARFVIANETRDGRPFLNVVYLANLRHASGRRLILGSQFVVSDRVPDRAAYELALRTDLQTLAGVMAENDWMIMGSMDALANTASLLAQHRLEEEWGAQ